MCHCSAACVVHGLLTAVNGRVCVRVWTAVSVHLTAGTYPCVYTFGHHGKGCLGSGIDLCRDHCRWGSWSATADVDGGGGCATKYSLAPAKHSVFAATEHAVRAPDDGELNRHTTTYYILIEFFPFVQIVFDGNIGVGKSTVMSLLGLESDIEVVREPVDAWRECNGENILVSAHVRYFFRR